MVRLRDANSQKAAPPPPKEAWAAGDAGTASWQVRTWWDWLFVTGSFVVFACLEGALIYAYYIFLQQYAG